MKKLIIQISDQDAATLEKINQGNSSIPYFVLNGYLSEESFYHDPDWTEVVVYDVKITYDPQNMSFYYV